MNPNSKTWGDLVREVYGKDVSDEDVNTILMETTAYPFASAEYIEKQLRENFEKYKKDLDSTIAAANEALNKVEDKYE